MARAHRKFQGVQEFNPFENSKFGPFGHPNGPNKRLPYRAARCRPLFGSFKIQNSNFARGLKFKGLEIRAADRCEFRTFKVSTRAHLCGHDGAIFETSKNEPFVFRISTPQSVRFSRALGRIEWSKFVFQSTLVTRNTICSNFKPIPRLQHADNNLRDAHDSHLIRRRRGRPIGCPCELRAALPHPGQRRPLPPNTDMLALYEQANNTTLPRVPNWAAARDPLFGQPLRQQQRQAAVTAVWGSLPDVWADILHNAGRARFIPSHIVFLSFHVYECIEFNLMVI